MLIMATYADGAMEDKWIGWYMVWVN